MNWKRTDSLRPSVKDCAKRKEVWLGQQDVWVAKYDSMGYKQIKLYNVIHPDLVPTIAEEAHKRGMRLSGHIPRGLSVPAAIALGFDEIQHAAFLFSTFYEDSGGTTHGFFRTR